MWALPDTKMPLTPEDAHFQNRAPSDSEGILGEPDPDALVDTEEMLG